MHDDVEALVARYRDGAALDGLPRGHFVGGAWTPVRATMPSVDPGRGRPWCDVAGAARAFEYYAGAADKVRGDTFPLGDDHLGYSLVEPVGVTAHVIPWNFPLSTAARGIAPALAAGCTVVAKPAEQTPLTALPLAELLHRAGLPVGVCNAVSGTGAEAGAPLVAHREKVAGHVDAARARGLTFAADGLRTRDPETGEGFFFEPTILDDVPPDDLVVREGIFGPVPAVQRADDAEHAVALANGTEFAPVAGVYTRDFDAAHRLACDIDAGQLYINEHFAGGIEVPFGGNRKSGFAREKGTVALRSYTRVKGVAARNGPRG